MIKKRKVCVVITARASYTKFKSTLSHLRSNKNIKLYIVAAASLNSKKFGKGIDIIQKDGFKVHHIIESSLESDSLLSITKTSSIILNDAGHIFAHMLPDVVLVMADRYEVLPVAIAASYQNIPVAHIQGGEITGNIDEKVRHAITKLADLHYVSNESCKSNLIQMGESENKIFNVGCPSIDVCKRAEILDINKRMLAKKILGTFDPSRKFLIVMFHPESESLLDVRSQIKYLIDQVIDLDIQILWFWPNSDPGFEIISSELRKLRENKVLNHVSFVKTLQPEIFLSLLKHSSAIIGNSSAGIRESNYFGTPSINIGIRQLGRECGTNVTHWEFNSKIDLKSTIKKVLNKQYISGRIYGDGMAGKRIAKSISRTPLTFVKKFIALEK